jgi:TolB-like protein/Tfp pilus assembly protein PilF
MTRAVPDASIWNREEVSAIRAQLERLLGSPHLQQAPRRQRLLRHIVEATLSGATDRLKGYNLGVEVFDRGTEFDPNVDPIVRVEMGRLRSKLVEFYSDQGFTDAVLIDLPKGAYAARIEFRVSATASNTASWKRTVHDTDAERPRIAVIPFKNLSADQEQEYFADGITEDLITDLSKLSGLSVISRHSSFLYKHANRPIEDIGSELQVRYILEGSVRCANETMRITAQLVDARSGKQLWAQRYDRPRHDVFSIQDDVTQHIITALAVNLTPLETARVGHEGTASLEAHDALLHGLQRFWSYSETSNREAQTYFEQAVALDGDYAAAHAWLARSLVFDYSLFWSGSRPETLTQARHHARRAVEIDGLLPFAHAVHCWAELWANNGPTAVEAGHRAVSLDPNNADVRLFLSLSLSSSGRCEDSLRQIEIGMALNPHPSAFFHWARGVSLLMLGRAEDALADFKTGIRLRNVFLPNLMYAVWACVDLGRMADAEFFRDSAIAITGSKRPHLRKLWLNEKWQGRFDKALEAAGFELQEVACEDGAHGISAINLFNKLTD